MFGLLDLPQWRAEANLRHFVTIRSPGAWQGGAGLLRILQKGICAGKPVTDNQHVELIAVIGLTGQTNHLVTATQIPVDAEFD